MSFEHADGVADFFCEFEERGCGGYVGGDAQVGLLDRDQVEEVGG